MENDKPSRALVVSLVGGPGAGKSTICAEAFAAMKWMGISCEMSLEYAKDKVWEGSLEVLSNQVYVFGKQQHRLHRLAEKVDVVITDAPLFHSIHYGKGDEALSQLVRREMSKFREVTFLLIRSDLYDPNGRTQTLEEARKVDADLEKLLEAERIIPIRIEAKKGAGETVAETVMSILESERGVDPRHVALVKDLHSFASDLDESITAKTLKANFDPLWDRSTGLMDRCTLGGRIGTIEYCEYLRRAMKFLTDERLSSGALGPIELAAK